MWRKVRRGYRRFLHLRRSLLKAGLVLFVLAILCLQFHTYIVMQTYHDGTEHEGEHFRFYHHYEDEIEVHRNDENDLDSAKESVVLKNEEARKLLNASHENVNFLTVRSFGRLGNAMFAYASLLGIAETNHMIPVIPSDSVLRQYFTVSAQPFDDEKQQNKWPKLHDQMHPGFDNRTLLLNYSTNIELVGHFQSWKYFDQIRSKIKSEFTFKPEIQTKAEEWVMNELYQNLPVDAPFEDITLVGIHVRRGDLVDPSNIEKGYTVPTRDYILTAVTYFERQFDIRKLVFVVCSDDMFWVKTNLRRHSAPWIYSIFNEPVIDLAILTKCHHVITTVGTFSWWAGFLSSGTTIYYANFPRQGSTLDKQFSSKDFYLPEWKRM